MRILLTSAAVAALLVSAAPTISYAQDAEDAEILRQAKEHYRLGLEAFKNGKYTEAIKELKKAYLLKRLPPLLVNIAKTYEKLNDYDNAIYYYKKYLAEAPPDAKDRDQVKQALTDIQAKKDQPAESRDPENLPEARNPGRGGDSGEEPPPPRRTTRQQDPQDEPPPPPPKRVVRQDPQDEPPPKRVVRQDPQDEPPPPPPKRTPAATPAGPMPSEWAHVAIDAAPPGKPVDVRVQTPVMKGVKVFLFYREAGQSDFVPVEMKRRGPEKIGRIPADAMGGKSIQYYIEAKDKTGTVVKNSGSQLDPNIVMIEPGAPAQIASASGVGEDPGEDPGATDQEPTPRPRPAAQPRDTEESPLAGGGEEAPLQPRQPKGPAKGPAKPAGPLFHTLGYIGLGLMGGGAVVAGVGGGLGFYYMGYYSDLLINDAARGNDCRSQAGMTYKGRCYFNDPVFGEGNTDYDFQERARTWGTVAPVAIGVGGAMLAAGAALTIYDYIKYHPSEPAPAAKPKKRAAPRKRPVDTEATPPADAPAAEPPQSSIRNLIISPVVTPTQVGIGAGFNF